MSNVDPNRRPSAFGRYVFMLLLGLCANLQRLNQTEQP